MEPLISIIIPVYKVESYLRRCIDSIINQTYNNIEIILVDDGSPDNSPAICDEYAKIDCRIKVVHKENGGLSDARNTGIENAKGNYITFVDSDDWVQPDYIETLQNNLLSNKADISIVENTPTTGKEPVKTKLHQYPQSLTSKKALERLFKNNEVSFTISCSKLYKKDLFNDIRFPIGKFHEDEFTTYKLFYNSKIITWNPTSLYNYFKRNDSITASRHPFDLLEVYEERYLFFKNHGEKDLLKYLLSPLCWQYLCAFWYHTKKADLTKSSSALQKFKFYVRDLKDVKISLIHAILLRIFATRPSLYLFCRKLPFHIRKEF